MTIQTETWEYQLLSRAYAPLENHRRRQRAKTERQVWEPAYNYCRDITAEHSKTFYTAASLLPKEKRQAVYALYAFCRQSDDLVDLGTGDKAEKLADWRALSLDRHPALNDNIAVAWTDTRHRYDIPRQYAEQLLDGVSRDLTQTRYQTFAELADYCYGVASTVGLMSMHIIGYKTKLAIPYAVKLGVALQLTNILRDVGEDWRNDRLYLPLDELARYQLTEADIAAGVVDERWRNFMKFQIERARNLYNQALPGIALLNDQGRFAIAAAAELYRDILDDIEAHDYDVFNRRAHTSKSQKLAKLPGIWFRTNIIGY